jgi:hypothetical protein
MSLAISTSMLRFPKKSHVSRAASSPVVWSGVCGREDQWALHIGHSFTGHSPAYGRSNGDIAEPELILRAPRSKIG